MAIYLCDRAAQIIPRKYLDWSFLWFPKRLAYLNLLGPPVLHRIRFTFRALLPIRVVGSYFTLPKQFYPARRRAHSFHPYRLAKGEHLITLKRNNLTTIYYLVTKCLPPANLGGLVSVALARVLRPVTFRNYSTLWCPDFPPRTQQAPTLRSISVYCVRGDHLAD